MMSNIVHVCSSESYPLANIAVYLAIGSLVMQDPVSDPSKTLVQDGQYWVDWVRHRSVFNLKCAARKVKLVAVGALLRMQGKRRMAKKVNHLPLLSERSLNTMLLCSKVAVENYFQPA